MLRHPAPGAAPLVVAAERGQRHPQVAGRQHPELPAQPAAGAAVVTVADNGGSSGRLRGEFGCLPPGDLRQALAALCEDDEWGSTWA
ncbi:MAG TPA: 2-phospho-L-lactate transferase CofD family protein, partial [Actinomycetes bacterium]|nr:2-phospho-L-lactate transferase CofD family protein [Actinomycetes bacterium]